MVGRDLPRTGSLLMSKARHEVIFASLYVTLLYPKDEAGRDCPIEIRRDSHIVCQHIRKVLKSAYHEYQDLHRTRSTEERRRLSTDVKPETARRRKEIYNLITQGINDPEILLREDLYELVLFYELVLDLVK